MNNEPVLVVMAAGLASRYGRLKQIDPVGPNNEILMEYSIYNATLAGFKNILFLMSPKMETEFPDFIRSRISNTLNLDFVTQYLTDIPSVCTPIDEKRYKPLGTAHAIHCCRKHIDSPFAVINADDYYGKECFEYLYNHLKNVDPDKPDYSMIGYRLKNTLSKYGSVTRGICQVDEDKLIQISDIRHIKSIGSEIIYDLDGYTGILEQDSLVSMGVWGFTPIIFKSIYDELILFLDNYNNRTEFSELRIPDVIDKLILRKECFVKVYETSDEWFGMTFSRDREDTMIMIKRNIMKGNIPDYLWE